MFLLKVIMCVLKYTCICILEIRIYSRNLPIGIIQGIVRFSNLLDSLDKFIRRFLILFIIINITVSNFLLFIKF